MLNNQRQEVTGVRRTAQPCTDPIGAVVSFGDGQNEIHATRMTQAGERWKTLELHCEKVLASIALAAARCQGSRRHSHGHSRHTVLQHCVQKRMHSWQALRLQRSQLCCAWRSSQSRQNCESFCGGAMGPVSRGPVLSSNCWRLQTRKRHPTSQVFTGIPRCGPRQKGRCATLHHV